MQRPSSRITDRARRYRARALAGPRDRCIYCGQPRPRDIDHISGDESEGAAENLAPVCHSCNTGKGLLFARLGIGTKTRQFNPRAARKSQVKDGAGAVNLAQWLQAVTSIKGRGPWSVQEAVKMIRATPRADRSAYASEIWRRRRARGTAGRARPLPEDEIPF